MVTVSKSGIETVTYWESVMGLNGAELSFSNIHAAYSPCCADEKDAQSSLSCQFMTGTISKVEIPSMCRGWV